MRSSRKQANIALNPADIAESQNDYPCLDTAQLIQLENAFREWADATHRQDIRLSRRRILIVFLLIRYTGAKLHEVLALDPFRDIDVQQRQIEIRDNVEFQGRGRTISIAQHLLTEIQAALDDPLFRNSLTNLFAIDPAFVRRKFYERAEECGFAKRLGSPEMIRRARTVELMQSNMPLPAIHMLLGNASPHLTTAHFSFSKEELLRVTRSFIERESNRKTSARNSFLGKITEIQRGDIQSLVRLVTYAGDPISAMITNNSLDRLGLLLGGFIVAEVKAPWVLLQRSSETCASTADNIFAGKVIRINKGKVSSEYVARINDGTELCALVSTANSDVLDLQVGDMVHALFNCFAVVLHAD